MNLFDIDCGNAFTMEIEDLIDTIIGGEPVYSEATAEDIFFYSELLNAAHVFAVRQFAMISEDEAGWNTRERRLEGIRAKIDELVRFTYLKRREGK